MPLFRCAFCKKESCEAGFSACGGSRKRHSSIPLQCDPRGAFLSYGNEVSYTIRKPPGLSKKPPAVCIGCKLQRRIILL